MPLSRGYCKLGMVIPPKIAVVKMEIKGRNGCEGVLLVTHLAQMSGFYCPLIIIILPNYFRGQGRWHP